MLPIMTRPVLSYDLMAHCAKIFRSHPKQWWEKKRLNREGEPCILMHDLLDLIPRNQRTDLIGVQILAWWLYDLKYTDPNATLFLDVDHLKEYKQFGSIWGWRKRQGVNVYLFFFAYLRSLCVRDIEVEWRLEEAGSSGDPAFEKALGKNISASYKSKADDLEGIIKRFLGDKKIMGQSR